MDLPEYFWRFCNPNFEQWENTEKWPLPMSRQEEPADLFLVLPTRLET